MKKVVFLFFAYFFYCSFAIAGSMPLDALKGPIDEIISIFEEPEFQKESDNDEVYKKRVIKIAKTIFDFTEISKRVLARNWRRFLPKERKEFALTFADFLSSVYYDKIKQAYKGEVVQYLSQEKLSATKAIVKTVIPRNSTVVDINYRMIFRKKQWRIYDVNIEGVSLVKNYRVQFNKILFKESPAQLIEKLKKKKIKDIPGIKVSSE